MDAAEAGRRLAKRHMSEADFDPAVSLLNYAEAPYEGDWTLRSALVRLAQPDPVRVGALHELMRRLDAALHHVSRKLESHPVSCDRELTIDGLTDTPAAPYPDVRTADLARLVAGGVDQAELLAGYEESAPLESEERLAVPLLAIAVELQSLAEVLSAWALVGPADPPMEAVDWACDLVSGRLDQLGVPVETRPPGMGRPTRG